MDSQATDSLAATAPVAGTPAASVPAPSTPAASAVLAQEGVGVLSRALLSTCFTMLALVPVVYVAYQHAPPSLATVDVQKLVEEDQQRLLSLIGAKAGNVTDLQRASAEKLSAEFARRLSAAVDQLGQECRCVLINKAALLSGSASAVHDYTDSVRARIRQ